MPPNEPVLMPVLAHGSLRTGEHAHWKARSRDQTICACLSKGQACWLCADTFL